MRGIQKSSNGLMQTLERLSTGKRINSAKDDPSGLIACELLRSDISAAKGKLKSNQLLSSKLSVVDSGLKQISNLLNQAKSIIVASANTGALSDDEIKAYQMELDAAIDSIRRITKMTSFQGDKVLSGIEGLLNGTMTAEQRKEVLGTPMVDSSGKLVNAAKPGQKNLGELSDGIAKSLKTVTEIKKKLGVEGDGLPDQLVTPNAVTANLQTTADMQETLYAMVDSWVRDRLGADDDQVRQQITQSLYDKSLKRLTGAGKSEGDLLTNPNGENMLFGRSEEELKTLVSENLESIYAETMQKEVVSQESDAGETVPNSQAKIPALPTTAEEIAQKLADVDQAEKDLEDAALREVEELAKKQAEEAQKAAQKAEKEAKEKEKAEKLEAMKQRADEMYWLGRKSSSHADLTPEQPDEKSARDLAREGIQTLLSNHGPKENVAKTNPLFPGQSQNSLAPWTGLAENSAADPQQTFAEQQKSFFQTLRKRAEEKTGQKTNERNDKKESKEEAKQANEKVEETLLKQSAAAALSSTKAEEETEKRSVTLDGDVLKDYGTSENISLTQPRSSEETLVLTDNTQPDVDFETEEESGESKKPQPRSIDDLKLGGVADLHTNPEAADKFIDEMIRSFSFARVVNGIKQKDIDIDNALLTDSIYHMQDLESIISDADFAEESSNLAKYQLLLQSGLNVLKIAQDYPKMILNLLMQG